MTALCHREEHSDVAIC